MTLTIETEQDEERQLFLTVNVPEERVAAEMKRLAREASRDIHVPGFRPGKAPYSLLVRQIGAERLRAEAADALVSEIYEEAAAQVEVEVYAQPELHDVQIEPLQYKFLLPLAPVVNLGDYRDIRLDVTPVEVTEEAVDDALEHLRTHHEVLEPAERPAQEGDFVTLDGTGEYVDAEGEVQTLFDEERIEYVLDREKLFKGTPFVDELIGMESGDAKSFSFTFPEDYSDETLAGREVSFDLTLLDVMDRQLPELDDELAKLEGDYETLDELRQALAERLKEQAEQQARSDLFESMMEKLGEDAELVYPPVLVHSQIHEMIDERREMVRRAGMEWEQFLQMTNATEESLHETLQEPAAEQVKRRLLLMQFMTDEKIRITQEDIEAELDKQVGQYEDENLREAMRSYLSQGPGMEQISGALLMNRIIDRMEAIASGNAPDLAELEAEAAEAEAAETEAAETESVADESTEEEEITEEMAAEEVAAHGAVAEEPAAAEAVAEQVVAEEVATEEAETANDEA